MSIQDYLDNPKFAYITTENVDQITGAKPGECWHEDYPGQWSNWGDLSQFRYSGQKVIYDAAQDEWLEVVTGPHCISCTC